MTTTASKTPSVADIRRRRDACARQLQELGTEHAEASQQLELLPKSKENVPEMIRLQGKISALAELVTHRTGELAEFDQQLASAEAEADRVRRLTRAKALVQKATEIEARRETTRRKAAAQLGRALQSLIADLDEVLAIREEFITTVGPDHAWSTARDLEAEGIDCGALHRVAGLDPRHKDLLNEKRSQQDRALGRDSLAIDTILGQYLTERLEAQHQAQRAANARRAAGR